MCTPLITLRAAFSTEQVIVSYDYLDSVAKINNITLCSLINPFRYLYIVIP